MTRRPRKTPQARILPGDGPTPETRAKVRHDVLLGLHVAGHLSDQMLRAAMEIQDVREAMTVAGSTLGAAFGIGGGSNIVRHPLDRMTTATEEAWRRNYAPWDAAMQGRPKTRATVFAVAVDNLGLREAERAAGIRNGSGLTHLADGLRTYAEMAGWLRRVR